MKHDGFEWQRKLDQDAPKNALIDKLPLPEHLPHSGPLAALRRNPPLRTRRKPQEIRRNGKLLSPGGVMRGRNSRSGK